MVTVSDHEIVPATGRQPLWPGLIVLAASVAGAVVMAVPGRTGMNGYSGTLYDHCRWVLLALLVLAGIGLLVRDPLSASEGTPSSPRSRPSSAQSRPLS